MTNAYNSFDHFCSYNFSFVINSDNELDLGNGVEADFAGFGQTIVDSKAKKHAFLMSIGFVRCGDVLNMHTLKQKLQIIL